MDGFDHPEDQSGDAERRRWKEALHERPGLRDHDRPRLNLARSRELVRRTKCSTMSTNSIIHDPISSVCCIKWVEACQRWQGSGCHRGSDAAMVSGGTDVPLSPAAPLLSLRLFCCPRAGQALSRCRAAPREHGQSREHAQFSCPAGAIWGTLQRVLDRHSVDLNRSDKSLRVVRVVCDDGENVVGVRSVAVLGMNGGYDR